MGEVPPVTCQLEDTSMFKLYADLQEEGTSDGVGEDTLEGILWAVGHDILM